MMIEPLTNFDYHCHVFKEMFKVRADKHTVASFDGLTNDYDGYMFSLRDFIPKSKGAELVVKTSTDNGITYDKGERYQGTHFRFLLTMHGSNFNAVEFSFSFGNISRGSISMFSIRKNAFVEGVINRSIG